MARPQRPSKDRPKRPAKHRSGSDRPGDDRSDGPRAAKGDQSRRLKAMIDDGPRPRFSDAWTVIVTPKAVNLLTVGHPWLFSGAIAELLPPTVGEPIRGGLAVICGPDLKPVALGSCNPQSHIAVRILERVGDALPAPLPSVGRLARRRLVEATELRALLGRPGPGRGAYRLINAEGDGLPGLMVDRIGDGAVVVISTAGAALMAEAVSD